jgi:hypothetical protein
MAVRGTNKQMLVLTPKQVKTLNHEPPGYVDEDKYKGRQVPPFYAKWLLENRGEECKQLGIVEKLKKVAEE